MNNIKKSLFYIPSTVLFVDDDPAYLFNIGFEIDNKIPLLSCDKPRDVIPLLENHSTANDFAKTFISHWDNEELDLPVNWVMKTDINRLYECIYNPNRFSTISTLVVDYSMPGLNGAELCDLLREHPIKKIMLTGAADYHIAIQLFNAGLIDFFIVKDAADMSAQLNSAIRKAQQSYFNEATSSFIQSIPKISSCLSHLHFWEFLNEFFYKNHFSEYYLTDDTGSFIFLDFQGNPTWMVVASDQDIERYCDIAIDNEAPNDIINVLQKKEKILFFPTEQDKKISVLNWHDYLHPAIPLPSVEGFYYSIITDIKTPHLNQEKIISHKSFMDKQCIS
jgi:CheY-like chemotaxis protein